MPLNPTIGDLEGASARIAEAITRAQADRVDLVVFPELCLCGYPPKDLLLQEGFVEACMRRAESLATVAPGLSAIVGCPWRAPNGSPGRAGGAGTLNSLLVLRDGRIADRYDKRLLPTYDVFDEDRYFTGGERPCVIDVRGVRVGLSICEDLWRGADAGALSRYDGAPDPVEDLVRAGARLIVNASASPFVLRKGAAQRAILTGHVRRHAVALASVNQLGGNDELIFDGRASVFVPDPAQPSGARLVGLAGCFDDAPLTIDLGADSAGWAALPRVHDPIDDADDTRDLWRALVVGARDYCRKSGFSRAVLGLSGGIDSAVACCIAAAALGRENILGVAMPSRFSSPGSVDDARALAASLGVRLEVAPIEAPHSAFEALLNPAFASHPARSEEAAGLTWENLQSRLRGVTLMAFSNRTGAILITTGNKSELGVGYCTIYGDMNGGLAPLADVTKAGVYALARWINANPGALGLSGAGPIPVSTIAKPPSAELRPDQTDQDSLPPYDTVDEVIERYVERRQSPETIVRESGIGADVVARLVRLIDTSEFKRRQAAPGLKVTGVAFGSGRRWPIAHRFRP